MLCSAIAGRGAASNMAYDQTGKWSPEEDSVATRIAAITAGGSPLMRQAANQGLQVANRRGLGNSSIAAGASQAEVIRAAAPIASQDAQQTYGKNLQTQQGLQQRELQTQQGEQQRGLQVLQGEQQRGIQELQGTQALGQLDVQGKQRLDQIGAEADRQRQLQELTGSQELGRQTLVGEQQRGLQVLQGEQELGRQQLVGEQNATQQAAQLAAASQQQITASLADLSGQRMTALSQTLQNEKIPAEARAAAEASFNDQYKQTINYLSNLYGVKLNDATPSLAAAP